MSPVIDDSDIVLLDPKGQFDVGDTVIGRHPYKETFVIKYVTHINHDGYVELRSPKGTDSRHFGRTHSNQIIGRATANLTKKSILTSPESRILNNVIEENKPTHR